MVKNLKLLKYTGDQIYNTLFFLLTKITIKEVLGDLKTSKPVFPKERERQICTVVVCLRVVVFKQTGNRARFWPVKGKYGIGIGGNAENVTAVKKGKLRLDRTVQSWDASSLHSYFPSDHLVPILAGREAGNLPMTAVLQLLLSEAPPPPAVTVTVK